MNYPKITSMPTVRDFRAHVEKLGVPLPVDETLAAGPLNPLADAIDCGGFTVGNRWCILPMEGWDGDANGRPGELTLRRWRRFGQSGAKLIWGGEAVAVRHDGRANPNQLMLSDRTVDEIARLRNELVKAHAESFGRTDDLMVGIQLTHSGRFSRPNEKTRLEPKIAYHHPILDRRCGIGGEVKPLSDGEVREIIADYAAAARLAGQARFDFADIKACHGYLGHEFLSAVDRPGEFGGPLENRTRFLRETIAAVRAAAPGLRIGVRLSAFDFVPFRKGGDSIGAPEDLNRPYRFAFGGDGSGLGIDLAEPLALIDMLAGLGVKLICVTAGSPYYNSHIQRPAYFPPSDGYLPPEDPLAGVARMIDAAAKIKTRRPGAIVVGSGYSCLQEYLPNVAQAVVSRGQADFVGIGRMALPYPDFVADSLAGRPIDRKRLCRTLSDCTTAPRNGLVSGCYPLDEFYRRMNEYHILRAVKPSAK
ncbi:MAG: NADH:flavin oxidoreductase [Planctomycetes bacterium]|nr:NADH:flavin oxidoreductase [Planctomycetota bacterium]